MNPQWNSMFLLPAVLLSYVAVVIFASWLKTYTFLWIIFILLVLIVCCVAIVFVSMEYPWIRKVTIVLFPKLMTKKFRKIILFTLMAYAIKVHVCNSVDNAKQFARSRNCVNMNVSELIDKIEGNAKVPINSLVDALREHNKTLAETLAVLKQMNDSLSVAIDTRKSFVRQLGSLHKHCQNISTAAHIQCELFMNQAEKACYEMHLAAFCAPFRIAKGICQLIQIGKATCQIPKAIETAIREGLSSVVASGRGQIEQRAKDSLFWDVVLRTQDGKNLSSALLLDENRNYTIKVTHNLDKLVKDMMHVFNVTKFIFVNVIAFIIDWFFVPKMYRTVKKTRKEIRRMEDTGLSQEEEEFQWDGWLKPFRRIFLGKPVVEVATYSVMFVIVYYFDVLLYYILNEFAHDALNAKSDLQRSYGIEVNGTGFLADTLSEITGMFQSNDTDVERWNLCFKSFPMKEPDNFFWGCFYAGLAAVLLFAEMFAQLTQKWVIINVVNLPDPDHQGPENMEMGQLLPNHQDEEEHQQQKEQDPVVPDHEHQHHVEIGFPVSNHREQQEQDPRETTL